MDKSMLTGIGIGVIVAVAGGSIAGYNVIANKESAHAEGGEVTEVQKVAEAQKFAEVLHVAEVTKTVQVPREVCEDVPVTRQKPVKDENRIVGTVAGALLGGVLGNQVGGGTGKKLATVAGAAAGGYAGNQVQKNMQEKDTYTELERHCRTVNESKTKVIGYDVSYRLGDQTGKVRMDHKPGKQIPMKDGQLVLTGQPATTTDSR